MSGQLSGPVRSSAVTAVGCTHTNSSPCPVSGTSFVLDARLAGSGPDVFFQAEDGIRDVTVTGVQTCALPISGGYAVLGFDRLTWFRSGNNWIATRCTPWDSPVRCHRSVGRQPAVSTMGTGATKQRDG